jgi:hypothetical protein
MKRKWIVALILALVLALGGATTVTLVAQPVAGPPMAPGGSNTGGSG